MSEDPKNNTPTSIKDIRLQGVQESALREIFQTVLKQTGDYNKAIEAVVAAIYANKPQEIAKELSIEQAKALAQLRKDIPDHLKGSINEVLKTLFVNGVMTDMDTWKSYQKRFEGIQDEVIKRAMNTAMAPYEMMGTLASLGVMFGGIAQMAGTAFDKPEWAAWGKSTIADSIKMAEFASKQQMAMKDSMTDEIKRTPKDWDPQFNYAKQGSAVLHDAMRLYLDGKMDEAVLRNILLNATSGATPNSTARGFYGPISALSGATRDQVFTAMILQESNGNPSARSAKGAMGLGQIMPETAQQIAKEMGIPFNQAEYNRNPELQIKMSRYHFNKLADKYNDNMVLVLAAYNSGEGAVEDFMNGTNLTKNTRGGPTNPSGKRLGDPRKNQTTDVAFAENYPYAETRIYIGKIADRVNRGVGFDVSSVQRQTPEQHAAAETKALIDRAKGAKPPFDRAARDTQAPKTSDGGQNGLRQTAEALSYDGDQPGSFADGAKQNPITVTLVDPKHLQHLTPVMR